MLLKTPKRRGIASAAALAVVLGGCRGCANDHPYVPPASEPSTRPASDAGAALMPGTTEDRDGGAVVAALVAPPSTTTWNVSGMTLEAGGRELVLALVGDFDGDGKKDALAVVRPPEAERKPGTTTGDVVFFHGGDGPQGPAAIASGPALGVQPSCAPVARLERIGPVTAFAEIGFACAHGAGSRAIVVVRLPRPGGAPFPAIAFDAVVVDPPQAPKLTIDVDAVDRDRDGIDDTVLRVTVEGGDTAPRAAAKLAFFDRPAGPSRDPDEPEGSLKTLAAQASTRAAKAKEAGTVLPIVSQLRALYRAMCLEGGAPRITKIHGGSATPCGTSKALEDAAVAEVRALVVQGDALRAFAAAESAQSPPATKTASRSAELTKLLGEVAPVVTATNVRMLGLLVDAPHDQHPEWGPLAFEHSGKLLVRHGSSVMRVDAESGESNTADMVAWKDEVLSPDGQSRFLEAYHACEGVSLRATFAPTGDGDMADVLLPIVPRLGKTCSGARGEPAVAVPIAWGPRGLEAIVAGQPLLIKLDPPTATPLTSFLDEPPPPGSPRSHGAHSIAYAVNSGILVRGRTGERWALLRSPDLEPYAELKRCTTPDDVSHVACIRRGKVVIASLPAP
jgi:hypothetical protein